MFNSEKFDELERKIKDLELELAKQLSKLDTIKCYMCHGGKYLEWVDWETLDDKHQQYYLDKAKERHGR